MKQRPMPSMKEATEAAEALRMYCKNHDCDSCMFHHAFIDSGFPCVLSSDGNYPPWEWNLDMMQPSLERR